MNRLLLFLLVLIALYDRCLSQWQQLTLPVDANISTLTANDSILLAGTHGFGIFASTDNGDTWKSSSEGLSSPVIRTLFIDGQSVFAGTDAGASISFDHGSHWNSISTGLSNEGVWSFAARKLTPSDSTIYAGTWSGIYASSDYGKSWGRTRLDSTGMPVHSLVVLKDTMYAATLGGGMFMSLNSQREAWRTISEIDSGRVPYPNNNYGILPVYALTIVDSQIVASMADGYLYFWNRRNWFWTEPNHISITSILCFATYNRRLFCGNANGDIFRLECVENFWNTEYYRLRKSAISSLAVNGTNIFAVTSTGIWRLGYQDTSPYAVENTQLPNRIALEQNFPNPFNPMTTITFSLSEPSLATLKIFDLIGREVTTLVSEELSAGRHSRVWNASSMPSGMYFYRLQTGTYTETKRLLLVR